MLVADNHIVAVFQGFVQELWDKSPEYLRSIDPKVLTEYLKTHPFKLLLACGSTYVLYYAIKWFGFQKPLALKRIKFSRERLAEKKNRLRKSLTDNDGNLMNENRLKIINLDINQILEKLQSKELDPVEVLEAFQAQSLIVDDETNCITDYADEARSWSMALREVPSEEMGPLHGLPISVKESFYVQGHDATAGLTKFINRPAEKDCSLIKAMKELGGVPFCMTNVPQTMKSYGCSNPIYGNSTHPLSKAHSPGGSTGGEAALLAMKGSLLGLGSDIGGSLRIPSHYCGVVGMKPTYGRLFEGGRRGGSTGKQDNVRSNAGFMSPNVDGIIIAMREFTKRSLQFSKWDYSLVPISWNENSFQPQRKLKIGWYDYDGYFKITPSCKRGVQVAINLLKEAGHELVRVDPPPTQIIQILYYDYMVADNGIRNLEMWEGEILDQSIEVNNYTARLPMWFKRYVLKYLMKYLVGSPIMFKSSDRGAIATADIWTANAKLHDIKTELIQKWRHEQELDVILAPAFPFPATPPQYASRILPACCYTSVFNVLDFPAGAVPVTKVTAQDLKELETDYPIHEEFLFRLAKTASKDTLGFPVAVQIIGYPWTEELVLHAMKELETMRTKSSAEAMTS